MGGERDELQRGTRNVFGLEMCEVLTVVWFHGSKRMSETIDPTHSNVSIVP